MVNTCISMATELRAVCVKISLNDYLGFLMTPILSCVPSLIAFENLSHCYSFMIFIRNMLKNDFSESMPFLL